MWSSEKKTTGSWTFYTGVFLGCAKGETMAKSPGPWERRGEKWQEEEEEKKMSVDRVPLPGMGFEPMCAYAHWILSPTP